jgi:hypothetical protein
MDNTRCVFRIHLIYRADGMTRPLSFRQDVPARSVAEALQLAVNFIRSAYASGFETVTWSAENLDKPVVLRYVHPSENESSTHVGNGGYENVQTNGDSRVQGPTR